MNAKNLFHVHYLGFNDGDFVHEHTTFEAAEDEASRLVNDQTSDEVPDEARVVVTGPLGVWRIDGYIDRVRDTLAVPVGEHNAVLNPLRDLTRKVCVELGYDLGAEPEGAEAVQWLGTVLNARRERATDLERMLQSARAENEALRARLRETAQILIAEVGAPGPMSAEGAARKAVRCIHELAELAGVRARE